MERDVVHAIRLAIGGRPDLAVLWLNPCGVATTVDQHGGTRTIRYGLAVGSSDLVGILRGGRFLAIEVKAPKGRVRPEQSQFLDLVNRLGGLAFVARSADEALSRIEEALNGNG